MASVQNVSIYQEARDRVEKGISDIIQCLNERKSILFRDIAVLENECRTKQRKLNSLKQLESLRDHTEEQLRDNLLTEIQDRVTQEIQKGIHKMNLEVHSTTVDYSIQVDWKDRVNDIKESIKGFNIVKVPKSSHSRNAPAENAKKKTRQYSREASDWLYEPPMYVTNQFRDQDDIWDGDVDQDDIWDGDSDPLYQDDIWDGDVDHLDQNEIWD